MTNNPKPARPETAMNVDNVHRWLSQVAEQSPARERVAAQPFTPALRGSFETRAISSQ
jgi:hypothetical protein